MNASGSSVKLSSTVVALALALGGCATGKIWLPAPAAEAEKSAPEPDNKASEQHRRIIESVGLVPKTELSEYVTTVGAKVAAASGCPAMKWKFAVLDSA